MINWHDRYAKLLQRERGLFDPDHSVLEVGCGLWGIALWLQRPVVGLEKTWTTTPDPLIEPVEGDVRHLPFDANAFDYVVCVDVLEHLAQSDRPVALNELIRVARHKVLVSCPCGSAAEDGERAFAELLDALGLPRPDWLEEHFDNGLPSLQQVVRVLVDSGYAFEVVGNENRLQHYAGLLLDTALPAANSWNVAHAAKTVVEPPVGEATWDEYYSYLFAVDKQRRLPGGAGEDLPSRGSKPLEPATWALYSVVHDASFIDDIAPIRYVRSGAAATAVIPAVQPSPLVDGGYLPNGRYSELSAMYSVWKDGPTTDVVGFCHYRRFFDFRPDAGDGPVSPLAWSAISRVKPDSSFEELVPRVADGKIIVARPVDLGVSVFDNYSRYHNVHDYLLLLAIVTESHPELLPFFLDDLEATELYCGNMFVMPWRMFDALCSTWFPVLQEFCARADEHRGVSYQGRDAGYLGERLFSPWIKYVRSQGVEIDERPIFFVGDKTDAGPSAATTLTRAAQEPAVAVGAPLRAARAALDAERARAESLETELAAREDDLDRSRVARDAFRAALETVAASASWRVTAPLRSASRLARDAAAAARRRASE